MNSALEVCRRRYGELARECRRDGMNSAEIEQSRRDLTRKTAAGWWLKVRAYAPTGIALGNPLPHRMLTRLLQSICTSADCRLRDLTGINGPTLALVPSDNYHVTIVNKRHFDEPTAGSYRRLTPKEALVVQHVLRTHWGQPLRIVFRGLILTRSGRLIVPGYPEGARLFRLRADLHQAVPTLRVNVPSTAHVKLAHLLVDLDPSRTAGFLKWLAAQGSAIDACVEFDDVYTPVGRMGIRRRTA
jgi:hypothetical protein